MSAMTAAELIEQLNLLDEHERLEAKRGNEVGRATMETVCAFANEPGLGGGTLLLGVAAEAGGDLFPLWQAVGVAQPDKIAAELATRCRGEFNVPVRVDIRAELADGRPVLVVTVPEAAPADKPVYLKSRGLPRGAFRRIGSTDQECTEEDLLALYQGRQVETFDAGLLPEATADDLDPEAIDDYRRSLAAANPQAEALRWSDAELLLSLGALRRPATPPAAAAQPTVAGLLLFGRATALRRLLPFMRIDYIRVPGKEWVDDPQRRFDSVEIRAPLLRAVRRAVAAVLDDLPRSFNLPADAVQRRDIPRLPVNVVREAIVNAVMHRSYRVHGAVQIVRYANRLEVRNPGYSLKPVEHLGEPGSQLRNPRLAAVLYETQLAETKGSGIGAMRRLMTEAGLEPPLFDSDRGADRFVATYFFQHFLNEESIAWLAQFRELRLTDQEARALIAVREQGAIDNAMYREVNRVDTLAASQALRRLRDAGLLEQRGRGSATHYLPTPRLLPPAAPVVADDGAAAGLSPKLGALSPKLDGLSPKLGTLSPKLPTPELDGLPEALRAQIAALGRRSPPAAIESAIEALCSWREMPLEKLARRLGRTRDTVRDYAKRMLKAGRLRLKYPQQPNHPQQAYRAAKEAE